MATLRRAADLRPGDGLDDEAGAPVTVVAVRPLVRPTGAGVLVHWSDGLAEQLAADTVLTLDRLAG